LAALAGTTQAAESPTAAQALTLTPIQPLVEYATPPKEESAQCTIKPEKENGITSWVVRNKQGEVLRKFADTNNDNVVDQWCYFSNGLEVYRDIDSNFNGKADEYRWLNTAGTRRGVDKNEDGRVDSWTIISPHEVAEQIVFALKTKDPARFQLLLLTPEELNGLGFGKARAESTTASIKAAPAAFSQILSEQKVVGPQTRFVDFGSARPGTIPAGTDGSTKDVIICDNGTALVQNDNKSDQIFMGTLVQVGSTWKLIDAPVIGSENQRTDGGFFAQVQATGNSTGENSPSDEMQKLMAEYERLDKEAESLPPEQLATNVENRVTTLQKLAEAAPAGSREDWQRQMIDVISVAIQSGNYPKGVEKLADLQKKLEADKADEDLIAHAVFQSLWAQFALAQHEQNANMTQLQTKWLTDLEQFVKTYPKSADTAEALLQLGMYQDLMANNQDANKWYQQLVTNFPKAKPAERASGALTRINSAGKMINIRGKDMLGSGTIDLAQYRGRAVLIQYWATWSEASKADMATLNTVYSKRGGRSGDLEIISICLDDNPTAAKQFLAQNKYPWKNIFEPGGLESRLANEMGVMTVPLMLLVDPKGTVVNQNLHAPELETELAKLQPPAAAGAAAAANALRGAPTSR
jgi:hypothetical protein